MPQSLVRLLAHIVFSTKDRVKIITPEIEPQLFAYISGIIRNNGGRMIIAGGIADHIHLLVSLGRMDVGELIGDIKRDSSRWIKRQDRRFERFIGSAVTARFQSVNRKSRPSRSTSKTKRGTTKS